MCHHCHRSETVPSVDQPTRPDRPVAFDDRALTDQPDPLRRRLLVGVGIGLATGLAGCSTLQSGGTTPEPVTLTTDDACDVCGMVIPNHPGPSAEVFYEDQRPSGHDNPARFCSTWEAFQYHFERQDRGWTASAFYVTDYSAVDYDVSTAGGDRLISTHPEASAFVDAETVTFVVASEVKGAMGKDLVAFSDETDAESLQSEYGGSLATFDEVSRATIAGLAQS